MKIFKLLLLILTALPFMYACSSDNPIVKKPIDCPPFNWPDAIALDPNDIMDIAVTIDNKYLFYSSLNGWPTRIVNLSTLSNEIFDFSAFNNDTVTITSIWSILTCPYNSKLLLLNCSAKLGSETEGKNCAVLIDYESKTIIAIVPNRFFVKWMEYSKPNSDYLADYKGTYNLQTEEFTLDNNTNHACNTSYSYDGLHSIASGVNSIIMNGKPISISDTMYKGMGNFTRDGKKVVMTAYNFRGANVERHQELWVIDFDYFLKSGSKKLRYNIISLRDNFCKYNITDFFTAQFTSNNTIILVMHKDYSNDLYDKNYIYELSMNGDMIRQITF